jgi:hypothetical protein
VGFTERSFTILRYLSKFASIAFYRDEGFKEFDKNMRSRALMCLGNVISETEQFQPSVQKSNTLSKALSNHQTTQQQKWAVDLITAFINT